MQELEPSIDPQNRELMREFISIAVHDLLEPLRMIRLGSQMLTAPPDSGETASKGAQYLQSGAVRMEALIRDIAEYCMEETRDFVFETTAMESVLVDAKLQLAAELKGNSLSITHDPLPIVFGDAASLTVAVRCLISNASKFRGEETPSVHFAAERAGNEWIFAVRDNGIGFDQVYSDRIFRPFERLNGRLYPGSGLGLALARRIFEKQNGRIWAESAVGMGSVFRFALPVAH